MRPVTIFTATTGVDNHLDDVRLPGDGSGVVPLVAGVNITLDKSGRPIRRDGYSLVQAGAFHSIFATERECYAGIDSFLYRVADDLTLQGVRGEMSGARVSFVETPRGIYYANRTNKGRLVEGVSHLWERGEYVGPPTTRQFSGPPEGLTHLELFAGRMFGAVDNALVWSEPFNFDLWTPASNFLLYPSRLRMVKAVGTGLFVSDEARTHFHPGTDPAEFTNTRTGLDEPALEWSVLPVLLDAADVGLEGGLKVAVWVSASGLAYGLAEGRVERPTLSRIEVPTGFVTGAVVRDGDNLKYTMFN